MSQRTKILTQLVGFRGWIVAEHHWESRSGARLEPVKGYDVPADARLVFVLSRRFTPRCAKCLAIGGTCHEQQRPRRWVDLPCSGHPVVIEYAPWRLSCRRCGGRAVELLAWAEPYQRQTRRLQQHLALDAFSMPLVMCRPSGGSAGTPYAAPSSTPYNVGIAISQLRHFIK